MTRIAIAVVAIATQAACTMDMIAQMSGPTQHSAPRYERFPQAEAMIKPAFSAWAAPRVRRPRLYRAFITQASWNEESLRRGVPLMLYTLEEAGGVVKGANGETGVCFYNHCSLMQNRAPDGVSWMSPYLDCNEHMAEKATCASVERMPAIDKSYPRLEYNSTKAVATAPPAQLPPPAPPKPAVPDTDTILAEKAGFTVTLSAVRIAKPGAKGNDVLLEIRDDGQILVEGQPAGRVSDLGLITNKDGKRVGAVDKNGVIWTIADGEVRSAAQIHGSSIAFRDHDKVVRVKRDGKIEIKGRTVKTTQEKLTPSGAEREMAMIAVVVAIATDGLSFM